MWRALFIASGSMRLPWRQRKSRLRNTRDFSMPPGTWRPPTGATPTSVILSSRWSQFPGSTALLIAIGFPRSPARIIGYRQKPSGKGRREAAPRAWPFLGGMIRRRPALAIMLVGRVVLSLSENQSQTLTAYLRCARTFTSGVAIGSQPATTRFPRIGIRGDRKRAAEKHRAADPGGTRSRSLDVRHVPAFLRNSNTPIMAFAW